MHNPEVKIIFALVVSVSVQSACSYPQFSIPFVSRNNNRENPSRFPINIRVQNPFSDRIFSGFRKDNRKSPSNNEIVKHEKIITVTPNSDIIPENVSAMEVLKTTQKSRVFGSYGDQIYFAKDNERIESNTYDNLKEDGLDIEDREKSDNYIEVTTDYTTETSTDYESTTSLDDDIFNRSGISSNVVASLLG